MKITLLPYESCMKVGRELVKSHRSWVCEDYGLPKEIFGQTFEAISSGEGYFEIDTRSFLSYFVPAIFVSYVSHGN